MFWEFKGKSVNISILYNVEIEPVEIYSTNPNLDGQDRAKLTLGGTI